MVERFSSCCKPDSVGGAQMRSVEPGFAVNLGKWPACRYRREMAKKPSAPAGEAVALLHGALSGDPRAIRDLVSDVLIPAIHGAVCQEALRAPRLRTLVNDVVQDVLSRLYEDDWARLRRFDPERATLSAYVWQIARNFAIDVLRRPRLPECEGEADADTHALSDSGPESDARLREQIERLDAALDPEELMLMRSLWFEGAPRRVLAAQMGISMDALNKRIERLEKRIRDIISDKDPA